MHRRPWNLAYSRPFMAKLAAHIQLASAARRCTETEHLRDEMREHLRLKEIGVLPAGEYETAKVRILDQRGPAAQHGSGNGKNAEPQEAGSERAADIPEIQAAADHHDERGTGLYRKACRHPNTVRVVDDTHNDEERGGDQQSPSARVCTAVIAATRMPMNIAMPPTSGISPICCLRPPGLSVMRRRSARGRSVSVSTTVTANASAVENDSPMGTINYFHTAREHPEILDDPAIPPQSRYTLPG